jgi:RNA polymerase sigma-70 factor, ECF subfamily
MRSATKDGREIRTEADRLERAAGGGPFHRQGSSTSPGWRDEFVAVAVVRAREGDSDAHRLLYLRYADGVYAFVCSIVCDEHAAEDITQTVFARLPIRLRHYEPRASPFGAWLVSVARNASIDYMRARRAVPTEQVLDHRVTDEDVSRDRLQSLREALAFLPKDQCDVVLLRFVAGLSSLEISQRLGRTEQSVNALQHRGRRRLREGLSRRDAAPTVRVPGCSTQGDHHG